MVAEERSSVTKAHSRLLCCFTGSPVSDSDEPDLQLHHSSGKSQRTSLWSKLHRKKKTVSVDATTENIEIQGSEVSDGDVLKEIPDKFVSAKKGYFHKFHKKTSSNKSHFKAYRRQHKPILASSANVAKEPPKKATCQVFSKCVAPRQQALLCEVPEAVKIPLSSSLADSKTTNIKAPRKRRLGDSAQQMVVLLMVAVALGAMLLGGRALAIFCVSAWFYLSPFVKDMAIVKVALDFRVRRQVIRSRAKLINDT